MYKIQGEIEGVAAILFNRFTEEAQAGLDSGSTGGKRSIDARKAEALEKLYRDEGGLYLPSACLKSCLLEGVKRGKLKEGKASAVPYIQATTFFTEQRLYFGKSYEEFLADYERGELKAGAFGFVDERTGRRPPKTGGACIIRRPGLTEGWHLSFELLVTDDRRDAAQIRRALEEAGLLCGLLDGRPDFGRFIVRRFERV